MIKFAKIVVLSTLLSACAGVPLTSMWKLRNLEPLEADPQQIRLAVITDKAVRLKDKSTSMTLSFSSENGDHDFSETSHASIKNHAVEPGLQRFIGANQNITVFYLNEQAASSMRVAQNRIRAIKDQNIKGSGSLAVQINSGCYVGAKPGKIIASIYAHFTPEQGYIKLQSGIDLLAEVQKKDRGFWGPCEPDDR